MKDPGQRRLLDKEKAGLEAQENTATSPGAVEAALAGNGARRCYGAGAEEAGAGVARVRRSWRRRTGGGGFNREEEEQGRARDGLRRKDAGPTVQPEKRTNCADFPTSGLRRTVTVWTNNFHGPEHSRGLQNT